ncbi:hypothetical protein CR513_58402, partial [Mucuna pruriens]
MGCPIEDYKWGCLKMMTVQEWTHHLMEVSEGTIQWYPKWNEWETFIANCGKSPNVPLMGTQGCSNYNPILTLRQNGYPIMTPPTEQLITPLELHGQSMQDAKPKSSGATTSYKEWLKPRIKCNGLPFKKIQQDSRTRLIPEIPDPLVVRELEEMLRNAEAERKALKRKLTNTISLQVETQEEETLYNAKRREVELKGQLYGLHRRMDMHMEELLRERSHREAIETKENLALNEIAEEHRRAEEKEQKTRATIAEL